MVSGSVVVRPTSIWTRLQLDSRTSSYDTYRGLLKVKLAPSSATVINHVELDLYLRGVVPVEMSPDWPAEALRAQTAAARSYAVRRLHPGDGSFDVYDDTRSQVYRGVEAERSSTSSIIRRFPGQVIAVNGTIVNAFFFATGGGSTENNEYVFVSSSGAVGSAVSYLRGIPDRRPDGKAWDAGAPRWSWTTSSLTRAQLSTMFKGDSRTNVGDLTKLDLTRRGDLGAAVPRHAARVGRLEDGVRGRVPGRLQRPAAGGHALPAVEPVRHEGARGLLRPRGLAG